MDLRHLRLPTRQLTLFILLAGSASNGQAQEKRAEPPTPSVAIGSRVRLTDAERHGLFRKKQEVVGTVIEMDEASVTVRPKKGYPVRILRASPGTFQVSLGKRREVVRGAVGGALAGSLLLGGIVAALGPCYGSLGPCTPQNSDYGDALLMGAEGGAVWGGVIALLVPRERWAQSSLSPASRTGEMAADETGWRIRPIVDAKGRGAGLSFRLAW